MTKKGRQLFPEKSATSQLLVPPSSNVKYWLRAWRRGNNFGGICLYVFMKYDIFESLDVVTWTMGISSGDKGQVRICRSSSQSQGHRSKRKRGNSVIRNVTLNRQ